METAWDVAVMIHLSLLVVGDNRIVIKRTVIVPQQLKTDINRKYSDLHVLKI
jgi:hypothetical protein